MITRFVDWLIGRAMRTPYFHLEGYLDRFWLFPYGSLPFGIAVRIHHILRSDNDRHLHDHPWAFLSIVLRGGYWEERPCDCCQEFGVLDGNCEHREGIWRGPGSIAFRRASDFHRLILPTVVDADQSCWTLFITFRATQPWGFLVDDEKVLAKDYLGDRYIETNYEGAS